MMICAYVWPMIPIHSSTILGGVMIGNDDHCEDPPYHVVIDLCDDFNMQQNPVKIPLLSLFK
jgi:hypothetical protein